MFFDFLRVRFVFGLKTAKSFQCARPLWGAPGAENKKTITPLLTRTHFLKPQRKINYFFFRFVLGQFFFVGWGPELL